MFGHNKTMSETQLPPPTRRFTSGYTYTPAEQADKEYHLKQLRRDWPDVNALWAEWVYDYCAKTPQEELDRLMDSGELDKKESKFGHAAVQKLLSEYKQS